MSWSELRVELPATVAELAQDILNDLGASGTQEDFVPGEAPPPRQPWDDGPPPPPPARLQVKAWFEAPDRDAVVADFIRRLGRNRYGVLCSWVDVADQDWDASWKAGFPPIVVSDRLAVVPPWDVPERPGVVIIEPGQGFGTGQHETTLQALTLLDRYSEGLSSALDVGCGSGVLALAAARLGLSAAGLDNDPVAVEDARRNGVRNGLDVPFFVGTAVDGQPADIVLANLFAEVLVAERDALLLLTRHTLILAGILADREERVRAAFDAEATLVERLVDGEWVALVYRP
jgi:ribosomal protein L11 methyltransferase